MTQDNTEKGKFGIFDASGYRVGIVVSQFNSDITDEILSRAIEKLELYNVHKERIEILRVVGCIEIPIALQDFAKRDKEYDCLIAIGSVVQGETPHFDYVCKIVSEGVLRVSLDNHIPIGFAILTILDKNQAEKRLDIGGNAVEAGLQSRRILRADR